MRTSLRLFVTVFLLTLMTAPALAGGNANFVLGSRSLDKGFWEPTEDQTFFGVTVDFGKEAWPIQLAIGAYGSVSDESLGPFDIKGKVTELSFGVLKVWHLKGGGRPYVGGGLSAVTATAEIDGFGLSFDDDDTSPGIYAQGGFYWRLGSRFNIGGDVRLVRGTDVELFGAKGDAD